MRCAKDSCEKPEFVGQKVPNIAMRDPEAEITASEFEDQQEAAIEAELPPLKIESKRPYEPNDAISDLVAGIGVHLDPTARELAGRRKGGAA